ncbi:MAG TPA: 3-phosphoshikimate 1-carboxyvinyltransferase, partial [Verrucomicrobiae bacterium]|nr:3-phosphoshikimate 1-carboxyvinyltransferase [Verrucomicrobiae bacterium]
MNVHGSGLESRSVSPASRVAGEISVPGDKSISHRSIMLGSLATGTTTIRGFLRGEDNMATLNAFRLMGVDIRDDGETVRVEGKGLHGLSEPTDVIDCGNSGTSIRLLSGLLAGQSFFSVLTGDMYLRRRPMKRVVEPLRRMGAAISGRDAGSRAPLAISGGGLQGISYSSPVASAQVKSALLLAGLYAEGETQVVEPHLSRDHSERMFRHFGADLETEGTVVRVRGGRELQGRDIVVPGDISSAAFFMVAALIVPGSELLIRGVGVNPTRTGILDILRMMGGEIELLGL